jgi:Zn-dependent protease with chaperone function
MATNFFAAQDAARARSRRLVGLFLASVAGLIIVIYLAVEAILVLFADHDGALWDPVVFASVAGLTVLVVGVSSLTKILALRAGGGSVARSVGGRPVDPATTDPDERKLINVVEEMAIASGVTVPEIYVLDEEEGINAFAAGFAVEDSAVAVTRGCIRQLNRDELQGVVAHEFSHILNGDMRLNIHLIGLVFGLLVLSVIGQGVLRMTFYSGAGRRRGNNKEGGGAVLAIAALGLVLLAAGWVGVLFGRLLQSAVSRQREFLADAAAVQFTRNPQGLAGALQKIAATGSRVTNEHSQDVAHLFFASGFKSGWAAFFATHPPIEERIRALDPSWDGSLEPQPPPLPMADPAAPTSAASMLAPLAGAIPLARARAIRDNLTKAFGDDLQDPAAARDLVLALFPPIQGVADTAGVADYRERLQAMETAGRTALFGLLTPALGRLPASERTDLCDQLDRLSQVGLDPFAFGMWWIVRRNLRRLDQPPRNRDKLGQDPGAFADDAAVLVASLVWTTSSGEDARRCYDAAMKASPTFGAIAPYPGGQPDMAQLDHALETLGGASFMLRREILDAATRAVSGDGRVTDEEAALMQVVALALDCPAPLPGAD